MSEEIKVSHCYRCKRSDETLTGGEVALCGHVNWRIIKLTPEPTGEPCPECLELVGIIKRKGK